MRGVPRWVAVLAVVAMAAAVCAFTLRRSLAPSTFPLPNFPQQACLLTASSSIDITVHSASGRDLRGLQIAVESPHQAVVDSLSVEGDRATASLRAGIMPGETKLRLTAPGFTTQEVTLRTTLDSGDIVGDGTPDFLRLHDPSDRLAFRRWFTLLAESQYFRAKPQPEIDDCAALLRFAYREALREHDATWAHAMALPAPSSAGDIQQYQYPYTPLGAGLFRVRDGSFSPQDMRDGAFAQFADAETLWRHNTFAVGRNLERARSGDLLFFRQDGAGKMPFHAMIFVGHSQVEPDNAQFVVYHTGPSGNSPGQIKRLSVAQLLNYPDARWRPLASNPAFLGVYRWNILRGGE